MDYYYDDWEDEFEEECEREEDEFENAVQECGQLPAHLGGGCQLAGTEHCDFECPFRDNPEWLTGDDTPRPNNPNHTDGGRT